MKTLLPAFFLLAFSCFCLGQDISKSVAHDGNFSSDKTTVPELRKMGYPIAGFAVSINPLGLFQYGPTVSVEFGMTRNLIFHAHIRFKAFGLRSSREEGYNDLSEALGDVALGGGPIYFFGTRQWKPYLGLILDCTFTGANNYANTTTLNPSSTVTITYMLNTGYRIRFNNGCFVNGGIFAGISGKTLRWDSVDANTSNYQHEHKPFFMGELTFGFEF
jgi:hypothetical protein